MQKEKETFRKGNKSQFSYINPNKMLFLFKQSANSEAKLSKSYNKKKNNENIPKNNNFIVDNNKKKNEILIEEDEQSIRGGLPSISPWSKNKNENDNDNDDLNNRKNNYDLLKKKCIISDIKKKLDNIKNNYNQINNNKNGEKNNLNKKNNEYKKINKNNILNNINIINKNNNLNDCNKNTRNKINNNIIKKEKSGNKGLNENKTNPIQKNNLENKNINNEIKNIQKNKLENKNINNETKNITKKISPEKQNTKSTKSSNANIDILHNTKNINTSFIEKKMESKNKKKNKLPYVNNNQNKKKFINASNNEFNFNSSSYINKPISFGVDNAPSEILKKSNINSFLENENMNNSSLNNYYNLNNNNNGDNNKDNNEDNNIINKIKNNKNKNSCLPQKLPLINNSLGIEENEISLINKKKNEENKNNLLLIDSLEIENNKKIDKNIIKIINTNENREKSLPPDINLDKYQQDSTLDYKDKKIKSNQKTFSASDILRLGTSNNKLKNNDIYNIQMVGQISLNYIHRPQIIGSSYIYKIRKNFFSSEINKNLENLINIKKSCSLNKLLFNSKVNKIIIIKKYLRHWKNIIDKETKPFTYSKTITSICTTENNDKGEYFSYYCKINKSNEENDFIFLRINLGYKLLRQIFCGKGLKKFFYLLKRRRRRKNKAKTYIYKRYSKNIFNLFDFKIKLPIILNKIFIKKYCGIFYHKFLFFSLKLNNNFEYDLDNNNICSLVREGYKKGYFQILYNILKERFNYEYYNTGLKFESFIKILFSLHE